MSILIFILFMLAAFVDGDAWIAVVTKHADPASAILGALSVVLLAALYIFEPWQKTKRR